MEYDYEYRIYGPFEMKKKGNGLVDSSSAAEDAFWEEVEVEEESLPEACGCYLFAVRAAKGITPWYVGLAEKQAFENECFAMHKVNIYNNALAKKKGTPILFLIAKRTGTGRFARPGKNGHRDIDYLETILIGAAIDKNPDLSNRRKTKYLREMCVPGFINSPQRRPTRSESEFMRTIE